MRDADAVRLGVMGGSFNPIHNAHLALAYAAMESFALDRVLFIPAGNPPHKREGLADKEERLHMVRLAVAAEPRFEVSDIEVRRCGTTYTVDTLRALRARYPAAVLWYLLGADTLLELHTWREPEQVLALCGLIVCARPGWQEEAVQACAQNLRAKGADVRFLPIPGMPVSATEIRAHIAQGTIPEAWLPPRVAAYLRENPLYRAARLGEQAHSET